MTESLRTVLITGAAGNLGTKVRRHLEATEKYDIRPLSKHQNGDASILAANLTTYHPSWAHAFDGVDTVVHLAADPAPPGTWDTMIPMNIDMTLNVCRAALTGGAKRIVFASSNWVMAGYRFTSDVLTSELTPYPVNPYGATKLFAERYGKHLCEHHGISFISLRIGHCQSTHENRPGRHMPDGAWGQQMWLSDRDYCQAVEKAINAQDAGFAVLNVMSANPGMRWDLSETRRVLGYEPKDGHTPVVPPTLRLKSFIRGLQWRLFGASSRIPLTDLW